MAIVVCDGVLASECDACASVLGLMDDVEVIAGGATTAPTPTTSHSSRSGRRTVVDEVRLIGRAWASDETAADSTMITP